MQCKVMLKWSDDSNKWYTETDDIPGMVLESNSLDALIEKVQLIAPDLLESNCNYLGPVHFTFVANHTKTIRAVDLHNFT